MYLSRVVSFSHVGRRCKSGRHRSVGTMKLFEGILDCLLVKYTVQHWGRFWWHFVPCQKRLRRGQVCEDVVCIYTYIWRPIGGPWAYRQGSHTARP